jgi:predicted lipoprotein with Yx(FWY)xxD motif
MRKPLLLLVPTIALIASGCGSSSTKTGTTNAPGAAKSGHGTATTSASSGSSGPSTTISSESVKDLGTILVNSEGKTLYVFKPDNAKKVTCTGSCAAVWPPVKLGAGAKPAPSGDVKGSMLSSDPNPAGGRVVTYNGWPLYTYVTDNGVGSVRGQALNLNGGLWYVMSPDGQPITKKAPSQTGSSGY